MKLTKFIYFAFAMFLAAEAYVQAQTSTGDIRKKPDELYSYACGLYRRGFYDMALKEYELFLKENPEDGNVPNAEMFKIYCLRKLGRNREMLTNIRTFRQKYEKKQFSDELAVLGAEYLIAAGRGGDAMEFLRPLSVSGNKVLAEYALFHTAQHLIMTGAEQEAMKIYGELSSGEFDSKFKYRPYAAMEYADWLMRNNGLPKALAVIEKTAISKHVVPELQEKAMFLKGELLLKMNRSAEAKEAFENCIINFPEGAYVRWCRIYRIKITIEAGEYTKALELLDDFREKYRNEAGGETDYWQAFALMQCKRYNEALPFFLRISGDSNSSEETQLSCKYNAIYCMFMSGNYEDAIKHAGDFAVSHPKTALLGDTLLIRSEALLKLKRMEESETACRKAIALFSDKPEKLGTALDLLVNILEASGKWQQAVNELLKKAETSNRDCKAEILLKAGECAEKAKNSQQAVKLYENAAAEASDSKTKFAAYTLILNLHIESKQYGKALESAAKLKTCCPEDKYAELLFNEANILYCAGKYTDAVKTLNEIIKKYGSSGEIRIRASFMLASILLIDGKDRESIPLLDSLFENHPEEIQSMINYQFLCMAGDAYSRRGLDAKAKAVWNKILAHTDWPPDQKIDAKLRIAKAIIEKRKHNEMEEAAKLLQKAIGEIESGNTGPNAVRAELYSLYAEALMLQKKYEMAMAMAEKAIATPDFAARSGARAMYILANIAMFVEKNTEKANRFATQCYILSDDPDYCPMAMAISVTAFRAEGKHQQAAQVLKELSQKYPLWLAAHPELRK